MFELANTKSIGDTPALADRLEQKILINNDVWDKLNPDQRAAVLLHEFGHIIKDTPDEKIADSFAYQKQQGSAARFFAAFSSLLDPDQNPDHMDRLNNLALIAANDIHQQTGRDLPKRIIRKSSRNHQMNYKSVFRQKPNSFMGPLTGEQRKDLYTQAVNMYKNNPSRTINQYYQDLINSAQSVIDKANENQKPKVTYYVPDDDGNYFESTTKDLSGSFRQLNIGTMKKQYFLYAIGAIVAIAVVVYFVKKSKKS
ncbi:MAG: hypothetical protein KA053_09005 [Lentimicrobiaceae bacterium]|nr:hypothetical protein [Lentimicrobiaceae bacterium]